LRRIRRVRSVHLRGIGNRQREEAGSEGSMKPVLAIVLMGLSILAALGEIAALITAVVTYYEGDIPRATYLLCSAIYLDIVARSFEARAKAISP
jgi:hypothetical protein